MLKIKWFQGLMILLICVSLILTLNVIAKPSALEERVIENTIQEKAQLEYKINVIPCTIYPDGGLIRPEGYIITSISDAIAVNIRSDILSDNNIHIKGTKSVTYKIIADNLWEKTFTLEESNEFIIDGTVNEILKAEYRIDIKEILEYIKLIETEISVKASKYLLKIIPNITGEISYNDHVIPITPVPETTFELGSSYFRVIKDNEYENKYEFEYLNSTPFSTIQTKKAQYTIAGKKVPVKVVKSASPLVSAGLLTALVITTSVQMKKNKDTVSEKDKINRKYKKRLLFLDGAINCTGKTVLSVQHFKALLEIADDKELKIINVNDLYCVVDGDFLYTYKPDEDGHPLDIDIKNE